jgi:2-keto-3-deoxy-galactonokinase
MTPAFIAGDWGISNLTLALCDADGNALQTRRGPGAAASRGRFAEVFDEMAAPWLADGPRPAVLCGSVGSSFYRAQRIFGCLAARPLRCARGCASSRECVA